MEEKTSDIEKGDKWKKWGDVVDAFKMKKSGDQTTAVKMRERKIVQHHPTMDLDNLSSMLRMSIPITFSEIDEENPTLNGEVRNHYDIIERDQIPHGSSTYESNEDIFIKLFADAIRFGKGEKVSDILQNNSLSILHKRDFKYVMNLKLKDPDIGKPEEDSLEMSAIHLAIITGQAEILEKFLEKASTPNEIRTLLSHETSVKFGSEHEYDPDDSTLHGINAIHLASRFHAKSLFEIVTFLNKKDLTNDFKDLFEAPDPEKGKKPIHMAVQNPSHLSTVILLTYGVDIEAKDNRGYTALHIAAAEGHEGHMIQLLEHGANVNMFGFNNHFKTPLHRAKTQKVVQHLLKYGADSSARMVDAKRKFVHKESEYKDNPRCSVMDVFLRKYPNAVHEIFQRGITTNGQDLQSMDLQIIFNFEFFFKEGFEGNINNTEFQMKNKEFGLVDEMAAISKIVASKERQLLKHPLAEAFLHLKWQLVRKYFYWNISMFTIFLIALTTFVVIQNEMFKCHPGWKSDQFECGKYHKKRPINGTWAFSFLDLVKEYHGKDDPQLTRYWRTFWTFGILSVIGFSFLTLRELRQMKNTRWKYFKSPENILEMLIILGVLAYFVLLLKYPLLTIPFGAGIVLLSWLDLMLLLGRVPSFGIYIYMAVNVFETLIWFLLVYSPLLIAFAISFFILLPNKVSFTNLLMAMMKSLTMMTGEFDLESNFHWDESKEDYGLVLTQILFIIFLIFVSIVIANLLIGTNIHQYIFASECTLILLLGLTVSKTEELFKKARARRLEKTAKQVGTIEAMLKSTKSRTKFLKTLDPVYWITMFGNNDKLFKHLDSFLQENETATPWKVCVLPHSRKHDHDNSKGRKFLDPDVGFCFRSTKKYMK